MQNVNNQTDDAEIKTVDALTESSGCWKPNRNADC